MLFSECVNHSRATLLSICKDPIKSVLMLRLNLQDGWNIHLKNNVTKWILGWWRNTNPIPRIFKQSLNHLSSKSVSGNFYQESQQWEEGRKGVSQNCFFAVRQYVLLSSATDQPISWVFTGELNILDGRLFSATIKQH